MAQRLDIQYVQFCTDGNAARKLAPAQPLDTMKLPKVQKHKQKQAVLRIDPFAMAGIVLSVVMVVLMIVGTVELISAREDAAAMASYSQYLQEENAQLNQQYRDSYDLDEVQRTALALGMVPKSEAPHVTMEIPQSNVQETESLGFWDSIWTFFAGLFA